MKHRHAITLLEVLIALFIIAVGLLGVAALLPIAGHELAVAQRLDRGATLGQSAFHDLKNRGWLNPQNWVLNYEDPTSTATPKAATSALVSASGAYRPIVTYDGTSNNREAPFTTSNPFNNAKRYPTVSPPTSRAVNLAPPFVIDPLWISYPGNPPATNLDGVVETIPQFAAYLGDADEPPPAIPRLSLRQFSAGVGGNDTSMRYAMADRLFRGNDDMTFDMPDDQQYRPNGIDSVTGATTLTTYQQYTGDFSWFFTVAPDSRELQSTGAGQARKYTVSVAVVYQRKLAADATDGTEPKPGEAMVYVNIPTGGIAQGGVTISGDASLPLTRPALESVRANEWLMLTAWVNDNSWSPPPASPDFLPDDQYTNTHVAGVQRPVLEWFRVVAVGDVYQSGTALARDITLEGSDWAAIDSAGNATPFRDVTDNNTNTGDELVAYATIINDVIAVYSKTIELEGISPW